jgi:hypothetical protein
VGGVDAVRDLRAKSVRERFDSEMPRDGALAVDAATVEWSGPSWMVPLALPVLLDKLLTNLVTDPSGAEEFLGRVVMQSQSHRSEAGRPPFANVVPVAFGSDADELLEALGSGTRRSAISSLRKP